MPRPRPPPTPASSTDIIAQDNNNPPEMEAVFALPPPAIHSTHTKKAANANTRSRSSSGQHSPPPSLEEERTTSSSRQRKRTLSGSIRTKMDTGVPSSDRTQKCALPPPPSRTRKIIQMKPKQSPSMRAQDEPASSSPNGGSTATKQTSKRAKGANSASAPSTSTSRKIARKTAHSIIERRRRFKMNEEFGVLKDMVPACDGVEMHKLAILQAGIEYLKYLEGCITSLKERNQELERLAGQQQDQRRQDQRYEEAELGAEEEDDDEQQQRRITDRHDREMDVDSKDFGLSISRPTSSALTEDSVSASSTAERHGQRYVQDHQQTQSSSTHLRNFRTHSIQTSATNSTYASPDLRPINSSTSLSNLNHSNSSRPPSTSHRTSQASTAQYSVLPPLSSISTHASSSSTYSPSIQNTPINISTNTGISPFIHAFQFSPDLARSASSAFSSTTTGTPPTASGMYGKMSPQIMPLPQAALPLTGHIAGLQHHHYQQHSLPGVSVAATANEGHAEATATVALMMMGNDRRGSGGIVKVDITTSPNQNHNHTNPSPSVSAQPHGHNQVAQQAQTQTQSQGKGMSVKDLLSG